MKRLFCPATLLALLGLSACKQHQPDPQKVEEDKAAEVKSASSLPALPTGPVAKVGEAEIANAAFRAIYDRKVSKYLEKGKDIPAPADRRYRKSLTERLIHHELLKQEAAALSVDYDKAALQAELEQQKRGIRDWDKHLERRGETAESLQDIEIAKLREQAILDKLGRLQVTDEEIKADYEKIKPNWKSDKVRLRASHILIPVGPEQDRFARRKKEEPAPTEEQRTKWESEAKAKADEAYALVMADGADFAAIAEKYSSGPSAGKGGDIGIFTADRMAEEFSDTAFKLSPGQISKPVKTKFGYHIIKFTGRWAAGDLPLDALKDQIVKRLAQRKLHQGRRELKEELTKKYKIENFMLEALGPEPTPHTPIQPRAAGAHPSMANIAAPKSVTKKDEPAKPAQTP